MKYILHIYYLVSLYSNMCEFAFMCVFVRAVCVWGSYVYFRLDVFLYEVFLLFRYEEFHPMLFRQHQKKPVLEFESFNRVRESIILSNSHFTKTELID